MKSKRSNFALAVIAIPLLLGYGSFPARAEENKNMITLEKIIESTDPDAVPVEFTEEYVEGSTIYHLQDIDTQILSSRPEMEESTISIVSEPVFDETELENILPEETVIQNGITYYLVSSEAISSLTKTRTEYGKAAIIYKDVEYVDELPETGKVTITDSLTGKEYVKSLPLSGYTVTAEHWRDDFSFPVTIYSVDADYYTLGDVNISKEVDLSQYGAEFLSYLNLDNAYYRVNSITLQGEPFEQDGEWVQKATAYGSRRTVDVTATYEGSVTIPPETTWKYQSVYSNINEETTRIYEIKVTVTYEVGEQQESQDDVSQELMSLWDRILEILRNVDFFAVFLAILLLLIILFIIAKKRKNTINKKEGQNK